MKSSKYEIDMCNGSLMDKLITFSVPLMVSGILQLMFNAVDIIVVGRYSGSQALAAVGSTTALINIFTNLFIGISLGANVLAARFYAAGRDREMSETVHTAILIALISGVMMAFVGLGLARPALELMDTPEDVIDLSTLYMRIYFLGMPFFMLYNYGAGHSPGGGRYQTPITVSGYLRCHKRGAERVSGGGLPHVCRGRGHRHSDFSADFQRAGAALPLSNRGKLSAAVFKASYQQLPFEADFSGGDPGGRPECGHQFFQGAFGSPR